MNRHGYSSLAIVLFLVSFAVGVSASSRWQGCWSFDDEFIAFYNGATGDYYDAFQDEAKNDTDAWDSGFIDFTQVYSYGESDQINTENDDYGDTGWAGLASAFRSGCIINYGIARINEFYAGLYTAAIRKHIACHEVGHLLGLEHNFTDDGCMNSDLDDAKPYPASGDADVLQTAYCPNCERIALQAYEDHWLGAASGGGGFVVAEAGSVGNYETFRMRNLGSGFVALQAYNSQYLRAVNGGGGDVKADANTIGSHETFELIDLGSGRVALKASNGQYLRAAGGGGGAVYADSTSIGSHETFELSELN